MLLSTFFGGVLEWYDFYIYATASAVVFNVLFFTAEDPVAGVLASFGVLAVGYVARPLGAVIFSHFGDRFGRKNVLIATLMIIGAASFLIGLLPTYATAGVLAPIALVVLRLIQGLSAGGEFGGALLMAVEHSAHKRWRGFASSAATVAQPIGSLVATAAFAVVTLLPTGDFLGWGWRIPFLLSILIVGVGVWIRLGVAESPVFQQAAEGHRTGRAPIATVVRSQPGPFVTSIVLAAGLVVFGICVHVFGVSYAIQVGFSRSEALAALVVAQAVQVFLTPVCAALSDRFGRRPILLIGYLMQLVMSFLFFSMINTGSTAFLFAGFVVATIANSFLSGVVGATLPELFTTDVRFTGVSVGFSIASVFGGLTPLVAASLVAAAGGAPRHTWLSITIAAVVLIAAVVTVRMRETRGTRLTTTADEQAEMSGQS
ncbi:MFS transporter [Pseudonocardia sp. RS010]|uniref:MFS transporter n=1 Tax=Pseudonocardia sp. RS010 TaxID=3385979 RepID=UPI0039A0A8F1